MKLGTAQFLDISPPMKVRWLMNFACFVCNQDRAIYTSDLFDTINATHFPEIRRKLCAQAVVFIRSFLFPLLLWNVDVIEWQRVRFFTASHCFCVMLIYSFRNCLVSYAPWKTHVPVHLTVMRVQRGLHAKGLCLRVHEWMPCFVHINAACLTERYSGVYNKDVNLSGHSWCCCLSWQAWLRLAL